jgi:hypothetical protein
MKNNSFLRIWMMIFIGPGILLSLFAASKHLSGGRCEGWDQIGCVVSIWSVVAWTLTSVIIAFIACLLKNRQVPNAPMTNGAHGVYKKIALTLISLFLAALFYLVILVPILGVSGIRLPLP